MAEDATLKPNAAELFSQAASIMAQLRGPGGCPWDREQTPDTIRKYTLEETYEVLDAIERQDWPNLEEELGDLLLQVLFYAQMAEEDRRFTLADVLNGLNRKLIRRHPHVFGDQASADAGNASHSLARLQGETDTATVLHNWFAIKEMEKKAHPSHRSVGRLSSVARAQNALGEAAKLGKAAARAGFDWPNARGLLEKVREETDEIEAELDSTAEGTAQQVQEEVGDLLFTVANLARHLRLDPEMTLRDANAKFRRRFEAMEQACPQPLEELTADELERAWAAVKAAESARR